MQGGRGKKKKNKKVYELFFFFFFSKLNRQRQIGKPNRTERHQIRSVGPQAMRFDDVNEEEVTHLETTRPRRQHAPARSLGGAPRRFQELGVAQQRTVG